MPLNNLRKHMEKHSVEKSNIHQLLDPPFHLQLAATIGIIPFQTQFNLMPTLSVVNISLISRVSLTNTFFSKYQTQIYKFKNQRLSVMIVSPSPAQPHHSADQVRSSPPHTDWRIYIQMTLTAMNSLLFLHFSASLLFVDII